MTISRLFRVISTCFALFVFPAVSFAADSCAENQMLIDGACVEPEFTITTTDMAAESTFSFQMSASGVFYVDFDDGRGVQIIDRTNNTKNTKYTSAAYANAGTHIIKMYGGATGYTTSSQVAAISFKSNTNIKSVDGSLGAIFGGSANFMFYYTFNGCTSLQSIPETLFSGVTGSANYMFYATFSGCTSLQSIPENLFSGVTGSAGAMFMYTFSGCTSLQSIPENLFAGVTGSAGEMFSSTFSGCTSVQSIPETLFSGVTGSSNYMFRSTFQNCTSLKSLPNGLFKNIEGRPATSAFNRTFYGCSNLSGYIPSDMFENLDSTDFDITTMYNIFWGTGLDAACPAGMYQYITGFESVWSGKVSCTETCPDGMTAVDGVCTKVDCAENQMIIDGACVEPEFTITTTNMAAGTVFEFSISAAGTYYIDWGDDSDIEIIEKTDTTNTPYSHTYADGGVHTIGMYGDANKYTSFRTAAISFSGNKNIAVLGGSLGAIFGGGANRMFYKTFYGCTSLQSIPATLFSGVSGSADGMFSSTFDGCTSLQSIPENLFSGVSGSANGMFVDTFHGCTSLQSVPGNLFSGVNGSADSMFNGTFAGCTSLQSIPENLFSGVSGSAENMFVSTFINCTSLQSIPGNLFSGVTGSASDMFFQTFYDCTSLTSIPENLFSGVRGSAERMFGGTFRGCTSLQSIPGNLFSGVTDSAKLMFYRTFYGCTSLTSIPENLFSGVTDSAESMFSFTFSNCTTLKSLPNGLFKNIEGRPATDAFNGTFYGCSDLSGYIPSDMFENLDSTDYTSGPMANIFNSTNLDTTCPAGTAKYITGFESDWSLHVSCAQCPDGMCSINKPCSPSANATGETTCQYNANTGDYSDCDECRFVSCNDGYQYINGECKIVVTCNPGQYLPAGASECAPCPAGHYCIGNTAYMYNPNYDQGISGYCDGGSYSPAGASECTECPIVTDPYGGLIADVYSYGDHDSIDTCVATYYYMPEYMLEVSFGMTVQDAIDMLGYNPDSDANKRGIFVAQCHYDTVTQQYTKNCAGLIAMCEGGYYTNAEINAEMTEEVPSLEASTLEEMLNTYCVPAEPGYWSPGLPHTDLENITQEEVSLTWVRNACPAGTTSAAGASDISQCVGGRTLHIGDDITMNLTTIRPETPRVMVFQVLNELYYGGLSDTEKTINKNTDKKFRIFFDNKDYWLHDYTVE